MGNVNYSVLQTNQGTTYIGAKNDIAITNRQQHQNSYFNIDVQRSDTFTMLIEGFEYGRYHASYKSVSSAPWDGVINPNFDRFSSNDSIFWMPLKSLTYSQGSIENMSIAVGTFSDLSLPFRKHCPTLTVEMVDHRSDFFEMKLREWHAQSVVTQGFVPVLESITKKVTIRGWAPNGECNSVTVCDCILADDISTTRGYEGNDMKVISFKLMVVGY